MSEQKSYLEALNLAEENDRRVASASVRLGDALIWGIAVWPSPRGQSLFPYTSARNWFRRRDSPTGRTPGTGGSRR
jgi:hypothetical protein